MSVNYNDLLREYPNKGEVGKPEIIDDAVTLEEKVAFLATKWEEAKFVVVLTGAGISTSAGIADFRGPNGVWTCEKEGKPSISVDFSEAIPTNTHMALVALERAGKLNWLVSQNVDGLHLKSGFPRKRLAEMHGNLFMERCNKCQREYIRDVPTNTVGLQPTGNLCEGTLKGRSCRGKLHDVNLDWEDELPKEELQLTYSYLKKCDLFIALGTSLEIEPIGSLPILAQKYGATVFTINLQSTKYEKKIKHKIHAKVDNVFNILMNAMRIEIPRYEPSNKNF